METASKKNFEVIKGKLATAQAFMVEAEQEFDANLYWPSSLRQAESEMRAALKEISLLTSGTRETPGRCS